VQKRHVAEPERWRCGGQFSKRIKVTLDSDHAARCANELGKPSGVLPDASPDLNDASAVHRQVFKESVLRLVTRGREARREAIDECGHGVKGNPFP
jgi:hypothetical protein